MSPSKPANTSTSAFKLEWQNLRQNKFLLVSLVAILFIPIMYSGFFLGSVWDPYSNTQDIKVAVVNEDAGATINDKNVNIGSQVVDTLKKDTNFKWEFVPKSAAERGLADGKYYMMIDIPSDFSEQAASITTESPTKSVLNYTLTPAKNYVGSLMTAAAAEKVASNVSETISKSYAEAILTSIGSLGDGLTKAADGATELSGGIGKLEPGISAYTKGVAKVAEGQSALSKGLTELESGSSKLSSGLNQLNSQLPTTSDIEQLTAGVSQVQHGLDALNAATSTPSKELVDQQDTVSRDAFSLQQSLGAYKQAAAAAGSASQALGATALAAQAEGLSTISVNISDVVAVLQLTKASQGVAGDSVKLMTDLGKLTATLTNQQAELSTSVAQLAEGYNTLAPNLNTALGGFTRIKAGSKDLSIGANKLTSGIAGASDGSNQVGSGTGKLVAKSPAMLSGISKISEGSGELSAKLSDAATQISLQPVGEKTSEQIAAPVSSNKTLQGDVPSYGYALAPYVLSLGLFVGALVFNTIYPVRRKFGESKKAWQWWAAKISIAACVAIGQAIALDVIMIFGLGLRPDFPLEFIAMSIAAALAFMGIVMFLSIAMNNVGRFIAMILLVLQLGGSEGTFPLETAPKFFQALNPYLPMTYSIRGFREAISSGLGTQTFTTNFSILASIAAVFGVALFGLLSLRHNRAFAHASIDD